MILLITSIKKKQIAKLRLLSICNEDKRPFKQIVADIEAKRQVTELAIDKLSRGESIKRRQYFENYGVKVK